MNKLLQRRFFLCGGFAASCFLWLIALAGFTLFSAGPSDWPGWLAILGGNLMNFRFARLIRTLRPQDNIFLIMFMFCSAALCAHLMVANLISTEGE